MDTIKKDTQMREAECILKDHGVSLSFGWQVVLGMILQECDYIEVHGFGESAYFEKMFE